jgi:hypothetical protein
MVDDMQRRCFVANLRSAEISEFQGLQTHLNSMRDFTGSLHRISVMRSNGRVGSSGGRGGCCSENPARGLGLEEGNVRVSAVSSAAISE